MNITLSQEIQLSGAELAQEFWNINNFEQAAFFNELARLTKDRPGSLAMQLQMIVDCEDLTKEGKDIMCRIGAYGDLT